MTVSSISLAVDSAGIEYQPQLTRVVKVDGRTFQPGEAMPIKLWSETADRDWKHGKVPTPAKRAKAADEKKDAQKAERAERRKARAEKKPAAKKTAKKKAD